MEDKGHYRCYESKKFTPETLKLIEMVNQIIGEYEVKGFILTLRQLYYQFVARALFENKQENYNRLGRIVSDGRMAGLISWTAIEDRQRDLKGVRHYSGPRELLDTAKATYKIDLWANQEWRPEVWVEKAALEGVIAGICGKLRVDFFATRGYNSQSEQWRAGQRFAQYITKGQRPIVFHFGDHDPSGLDMTGDNRRRLEIFCGVPVIVQRLALNMHQIEEHNPPPNPAKDTDSRFAKYREEYGDSSWELDALDPTLIQSLIYDSILKIRDPGKWGEMKEQETDDIRLIESVVEEISYGED